MLFRNKINFLAGILFVLNFVIITADAAGEFSFGKPLTLGQYNTLSRESHGVVIDGPVLGWPKGAVVEYQYDGDAELKKLENGAALFKGLDHKVRELPEWLYGAEYIQREAKPFKIRVIEAGVLTVITPYPQDRFAAKMVSYLSSRAFVHVQKPDRFKMFGDDDNKMRYVIYQKFLRPGELLEVSSMSLLVGFESATLVNRIGEEWSANNQGELLYNNIRLPSQWPPRNMDPYNMSPMQVPYLEHRPEIIPIDIGRQLFIDDFLIEYTDSRRNFHNPQKYEGNPILKPETELELQEVREQGERQRRGIPGASAATPKSGGVWWDPNRQLFKMWYEAGWLGTIALAISEDGINWRRPDFGVVPGTNQVLSPDLTPDSWTVVPEWDEFGNLKQWTMYLQPPAYNKQGWILTSPDGVNWEKVARTNRTSDRSTHFYNPFRSKWVFSLRSEFPMILRGRQQLNRTRHYYETDNIEEPRWTRLGSLELDQEPLDEKVFWMATDRLDPVDPETGDPPQLYNFDAVAYESIMLGMFQLHHGPGNAVCQQTGMPKVTELMLSYSRDGFHWDRPDRRAHINAERRDKWDRAYVQSIGNICTIQGDKILIYYIGFAGNEEKAGVLPSLGNGMYDRGATGIAFLRRDGFASLDAGESSSTVITRPVTFNGEYLFFNAEVPNGKLRVEIQDLDGNPIEPFTLENSIPFTGDSTLEMFKWNGADSLDQLRDQPVRFNFKITNGSLFAFWVSRDESGRSDGYVAGGGTGYTGPIDTVGRPALVKGQESLRNAGIR